MDKKCYVCGTILNLHLHHIFFGKNRKKADEDKMYAYLCREHHEGTYGVHGKCGHELDIRLKKEFEQKWLDQTKKTVDDFIKRYGKNYL